MLHVEREGPLRLCELCGLCGVSVRQTGSRRVASDEHRYRSGSDWKRQVGRQGGLAAEAAVAAVAVGSADSVESVGPAALLGEQVPSGSRADRRGLFVEGLETVDDVALVQAEVVTWEGDDVSLVGERARSARSALIGAQIAKSVEAECENAELLERVGEEREVRRRAGLHTVH